MAMAWIFLYAIIFTAVFLAIGCETDRKAECTYYCPYKASAPEKCFCLEEVVPEE